MRFLKGALGIFVLLIPTGLGVLCIILFTGHDADITYFEAVAQIIPILILALAIEARYLSPRGQLVKMVGDFYDSDVLGRLFVYTYTILTFLFVVSSEAGALNVIANQQAGTSDLGLTVGGLAAGMVALITSVLIPAGDAERSGANRN